MHSSYLLLFFLLLTACSFSNSTNSDTNNSMQHHRADHPSLRYWGRVDRTNSEEPILVGSASTVEFAFIGDSCQVLLRKLNPVDEPNYVSIALDGEYLGRIRLEHNEFTPYTISTTALKASATSASSEGKAHIVQLVKATESQNGQVSFGGVIATQLSVLPPVPTRRIEFIGNSITCGQGIDSAEIPCDSGFWYDQHNAYLAYGPTVARALNASYMLSSVSGMGMYRNWNSLSPVMPEVYQNLYLNTQNPLPWDFSRFQPDLVSIALGTNDFSEGDGINERLPFDSAQFVSQYIDFVDTLYDKYPQAQLCLLTSPMVGDEKGALFASCLKAVQQHFMKNRANKKPIQVFEFPAMVAHGCASHPGREDHAQMAEMLLPFYKAAMGW